MHPGGLLARSPLPFREVKQAVGSVGDAKLESEGKADKIEGKVQNAIGGFKDTIRDTLKGK
jgi:uncharacterized protein YjbJ (UPF0337 family)